MIEFRQKWHFIMWQCGLCWLYEVYINNYCSSAHALTTMQRTWRNFQFNIISFNWIINIGRGYGNRRKYIVQSSGRGRSLETRHREVELTEVLHILHNVVVMLYFTVRWCIVHTRWVGVTTLLGNNIENNNRFSWVNKNNSGPFGEVLNYDIILE